MDSKPRKLIKKDYKKRISSVKLPPLEIANDGAISTILDIDPHYYSIVEGRPIRPNTSINKYKQNIKDVALKRTIHGFLQDEILRIDREIESERTIYEKAAMLFEECQNSFDKFLADDNNKTITVMKRSDNLSKELANQTEDNKQVNYEVASLKSKLQYIDETLSILLSFEKFLHKAAPILWQEKENINLTLTHSEIISIELDIFRKIDIDAIRDKLNQFLPPRLYFCTPDQLVTVFDLLEKQNLNYLLVTEELNSEKNTFLKLLALLKNLLKQEFDEVQQKIKEIEEIITWNELREAELKEIFYRILEEKIKYLISSDTALQIFNYVEFAFEQLIVPNDTKMSSLQMAMTLEKEYDNLMLDLSAFDLDLIKKIERETYDNAEKETKRAKEANKLLKDVDKLSRRLKSSFEPSKRDVFQ